MDTYDPDLEKMLGLVRAGADAAIAAALADIPPERLAQLEARDAAFAREVAKAGAESVLLHLRNIHNPAKDPKNWRLSVWWLERRSRLEQGDTSGVPVTQVAAFFRATLYAAHEHITDEAQRQAFIDDMVNAHQMYIGG